MDQKEVTEYSKKLKVLESTEGAYGFFFASEAVTEEFNSQLFLGKKIIPICQILSTSGK